MRPADERGLLIAASPDIVETLLGHLRAADFAQAAVGTMRASTAGIEVI